MAAVDIFAKIGDVKGESTDSKHKDEIDVLSWSWAINQGGTMSYGGGGGEGKATFSDFNFNHYLDKASPVLMQACASGKHFPDATITFRKAGAQQQEYLTIKMTDVIVTNVAPGGTGGAGGSDIRHLESVSLQCAKVEYEYKPQKADGSLDAGVKFTYDIKQNLVV